MDAYTMRLITLFLAFLFYFPVNGAAQETGQCIDNDGDGWGWNKELKQSCIAPGAEETELKNPVGIRVSWPENPPEQQVEGYNLRIIVNDVIAAEESATGTSLSFQFEAIDVTFGDQVCAQVAAFRKDQLSGYSELNCIVVPEQVLPPMTVPGVPGIAWLY